MGDESKTNESNQDGNNQTSGTTSAAGDEFTPITSQADLDRIIGARVERERAKFSDYDDLKAAKAELDKIEDANKSEQQKLADQLTEQQKLREQAEAKALRLEVATKFGISSEDAELFLTGSDEQTLTKQAERLSERTDQRKKNGNRVPLEGATPSPTSDPKRTFLRELTGRD